MTFYAFVLSTAIVFALGMVAGAVLSSLILTGRGKRSGDLEI